MGEDEFQKWLVKKVMTEKGRKEMLKWDAALQHGNEVYGCSTGKAPKTKKDKKKVGETKQTKKATPNGKGHPPPKKSKIQDAGATVSNANKKATPKDKDESLDLRTKSLLEA